MPRVACPGCGGVLPLTDAQLGRRIECGRCATVFVAEDEPPRRRPRDDNYEDEDDDYEDDDPDDLPPIQPTSAAGQRAIASLIVGIVALSLTVILVFCCPFVGMPFGVTAIVLGMAGRRSEFRGLAVAGISTGAAAVVVSVLASTLVVVMMLAG